MDARFQTSTLSIAGATIDFEENGVRFAQMTSLEAMIETVSLSTNQYLIQTLTEKFHLLDHCRALRRYMLLGQVRAGQSLWFVCRAS
jgi:hypothetical protein